MNHRIKLPRNATLVLDRNTYTGHLIHYDTEILVFDVSTSEILKALDCSGTSNKAISRVADHYDLNKDEIKAKKVRFRDFYKYDMGVKF